MNKNIKLLLLLITFNLCLARSEDNEIISRTIKLDEIAEENAYKSPSDFIKPYVVISIGSGCAVAMYARHWGLREAAFPVDWCISPMLGIIKLFKNGFKNYFNKNNLKIGGPSHPGNIGVYETVYNIHSRHDFKEGIDFWSQYADIKSKYDKRVKRLYQALNSNKKVYFLRSSASKSELISFSKLINKQFPHLNYMIIAVNNTSEYTQKWNINRIKNYYLTQEEISSNADAWKVVFCDIGLLNL